MQRGRKAINTIWELQDIEGMKASSFEQLADMGIRHFSDIYKAPIGITLPSIIRTAEDLPRFVELDEIEYLNSQVSREDPEAVLKCFKKDKSPGPDGWPVEFYSSFFVLIGEDLLQTIEEC